MLRFAIVSIEGNAISESKKTSLARLYNRYLGKSYNKEQHGVFVSEISYRYCTVRVLLVLCAGGLDRKNKSRPHFFLSQMQL